MGRTRVMTFAVGALSADELAAGLGLPPAPVSTTRRRWFDTFDWRLWKAGLVLEVDEDGRGPAHAMLRRRADNAVVRATDVADVPRLAGELPAGPWRRKLAPVLGIRALIPAASARVTACALAVTDAGGETVAEAVWEELDAPDPGTAAFDALTVVRVVPRRGHAAAARALAADLARLAGTAPLPTHPLEVAAAGRSPSADAPDAPALDPAMPAIEAAATMLRSLRQTMELNEPWLPDAPDTEFLHDYRVALRRSRSVLKQARGVVSPRALAEWRPRLRELQQRTNRARDLDVFLLELDDLRPLVASAYAKDLAPLRDVIRDRRAAEQEGLVAYLRSGAHERLRAEYAALLRGRLPDDDAPAARRRADDVAAKRIAGAHRRLVRRGRAITARSPASALHELRISAKELRYLLELYAPLCARKPRASLVRELKRLQDNLGEFQDSDVHAAALAGHAELLDASDRGSAGTTEAIGLLAQTFARRQAEARRQFAAHFAAFDAPATRAVLDAALPTVPSRPRRR